MEISKEIYKIIETLELELKFYKKELSILISDKPFSFQKKKLKEYEIKKDNLEQQIKKCQKKIFDEYKLLSQILDLK